MRISTPTFSHEVLRTTSGMVVAQAPPATAAGVQVLENGGNAIDAAVTTAFCTGVLLPFSNGIGGGGQMVVRMGDGEIGSVDFGMVIGEKAGPAMFDYEDHAEPAVPSAHRMSRRFSAPAVKGKENVQGYKSISVPGTVAGLAAALEKWGTIEIKDAIEPAAQLAESGFKMPFTLALAIMGSRDLLSRFPASLELYLPGGYPPAPGELFVQKDYARTLRLIGSEGTDAFYRGEIAERTCEELQSNGGILTRDDFATYEALIYERTLNGSYRGIELAGVPGACGASLAIETLQILDSFDIGSSEWGGVDHLHLILEAIKLATVDRYTYLGDPAITSSPIEALVDGSYAKTRAEKISMTEALDHPAGDPWSFSAHERPPDFPPPAGVPMDSGTTHLTVVDKDRNAVALTQSNVGFSGVVVPGVGVMMNNAMRWPETVAGTVNSIYPRARSVHNMSPLVL